jgi:hypothetical protein
MIPTAKQGSSESMMFRGRNVSLSLSSSSVTTAIDGNGTTILGAVPSSVPLSSLRELPH